MVYPWGVEQSLLDSVSSAQPKYGIMKDNKLRTWIDCIQEQKLADEIFLVTWHSWQISAGKARLLSLRSIAALVLVLRTL
jgi:transposase-like protein